MANVNPTGNNDLEEKKWLISRIDLFHKTLREAYESDLKNYENQTDKAFSELRGYRNNILSGIGVILTVVLGINATYTMGQFLFFTILTTLGVASLIVIIIFNLLNHLGEDIFSSVYEIYNENISKLAISQGFIITAVSVLSNVSVQSAYNHFIFSMLLNSAIMVYSSKELRKIAKRYSKIPQVKSELIELAESYEHNFDLIPIYYERFDSSQSVNPLLLEFVNNTLAEYKKKN